MGKTPKEIIEDFITKNAKLVTERLDIAQSQAGTESESSKDYTGRVVFEFFQNAIDKAESSAWLELTDNAFIISNDGEPFSIEEQSVDKYTKSDFHALNTIHNSNKKAGESVGNKGVGFKSCWNVSSHVTIESIKDNEAWGFDLFNPVTVENFKENNNIREALEKASKNGVPSFYFPKYFTTSKENLSDGRITKVTIHLKNSKAKVEIEKELNDFEKTKFFFLNQLKDKKDKNLTIHIRGNRISSKDKNWNIIDLKKLSNSKENNCFRNEYLKLLKVRRQERYANIPKKPNIAIAFPSDNIGDIESKFYTYLPTKAECGFNVLIHADFALDNARVSIPDNEYNNMILEIAAKMLVSELLNNPKLHLYQNFSKFLMPKHRDDKFAELVWQELIANENITKILQKVFTKDINFSIESYRLIFDVITKWVKPHVPYAPWGKDYWEKIVYDQYIKYFCDENIFIVYIKNDYDSYVAYLPTKDQGEDSQKNKLFYIDEEKNESKYNFTLLKELSNITLSSMNELNRDVFIKNNIVKENRNIEIYRALAIEMEKDINLSDNTKLNILEFLEIHSDNYVNIEYFERDTVKRNSKAGFQLARINLPTIHSGWQPAKKCFFNIPKEVSEKFLDFYEVDFEKIKHIFKNIENLKYFGAWNTIPITEDFRLPWRNDNPPKVEESEFKILLQNSIMVWKRIEEISKDEIIDVFSAIKEQEIFFDEINEIFCTPYEVFLFNDERKRKGINQAKKDDRLKELYEFFHIFSIEDTRDEKKLLLQLNKIKDLVVDKAHKTIYKQLILSLAKIKDIDIQIIPLLSNSCYVDTQSDIWFADRNTKRYKHYFKDLNFIEFDIETNKEFVIKVGIKDFNPEFKLMPVEAINKHQSDLKREIEVRYLADMFCIADETMNANRFDRDEAISRWNNLQIGYAEDVWIELKLNGYKSEAIGKGVKNDVLFKPLSDSQRQQNKGSIGEFIHDLEGNTINEIISNSKFSDFGYVIADGVFRDALLGPVLSAYLKDSETFLHDKGIDQSEVGEMKSFIEQSLLSIEEKNEIVKTMKEIGLNIDVFSEIRDFEKYSVIELSFKEFEDRFDDKYTLIIKDIINEYKNFFKQKMSQLIEKENTNSYLEILYFEKYSREEYKKKYENKKENIINKKINTFAVDLNIYKLFEIKKINKESDEFIEIKFDFDFETESISEKKISFAHTENGLNSKENPKTGSAEKSQEDNEKESIQENKNQIRGKGQELKLSFRYAKELYERNLQDEFILKLKEYYKEDDKDKNIQNYAKIISENTSLSKLEFAKKIINIANNKLDGLGYDLVLPKYNDDYSRIIDILKVELKTTLNLSDIKIHFSKNEIERILYFQDDCNFLVFLNSEKNDITNKVKEAVLNLTEKMQNISFIFDDYILKLTSKD